MRRVWDVYSESKAPLAQQGLSFSVHTLGSMCQA